LTVRANVIASQRMKVNFTRFLAVAMFVALFTGCYSTPDNHSYVGMPLAKDKIESRYERPVETIFAAAKEVLRFNGTLYGENTISHTLEAKVDTRTVYVTVDEVEPKISRVVVQARKKSRLPDIDLAAEIDKQIALKLATSR
jgi:hypothetical protein